MSETFGFYNVAPTCDLDIAAHLTALEEAKADGSHEGGGRILDAPGPQGSTPLVAACTSGNAELVEELLSLGANPKLISAADHDNFTSWGVRQTISPLATSACHGHVNIVKMLIPLLDTAALNWVNDYSGHTALSYACIRGHKDVVRVLLQCSNIDPNIIGVLKERADIPYCSLPLFAACKKKQVGIVEMLLQHDAIDVNKVASKSDFPDNTTFDHWEETALACVCTIYTREETKEIAQKRVAIVKLLLANPALDVNLTVAATALSHACNITAYDAMVQEHVAVVKLLLAHPGVDVNLTFNDAPTPLQQLVQNHNPPQELFHLLLDAGADPRAKCVNTISRGFTSDPNGEGEPYGCRGQWPLLHQACLHSNIAIAQYLITNCGADVNERVQGQLEARHTTDISAAIYRTENLAALHEHADHGATPLIAVLTHVYEGAISDLADVVQMLLDNNADINMQGIDILTGRMIAPLQAACRATGDGEEIAKAGLVLLNYKTSVLMDANLKCDFYTYGQFYSGLTTIHALVSTHENPDPTRHRGHISEDDQIKYKYWLAEVQLLTKFLAYTGSTGAFDINQRCRFGETALHAAVSHEFGGPVTRAGMARSDVEINPKIQILLMQHDLDIDALDDEGCSALDLYCMMEDTGHKKLEVLLTAQLLVAFGSNTSGPGMPARVTSLKLSKWLDATTGWSPIVVGAGCRLHHEISTAVQRGVIDLDAFTLDELKLALQVANTAPEQLSWDDAPDVCTKTIRLMDAAVRSWRKGWTPSSHWLFHSHVRTAVHTVLLVAARLNDMHTETAQAVILDVDPTTAGNDDNDVDGDDTHDESQGSSSKEGEGKQTLLQMLPPEMWCYILSFLLRKDWDLPELGNFTRRCKMSIQHLYSY